MLISFSSPRQLTMKMCCCKRKADSVSSQSVILIILWDALMYLHINLIRHFAATSYYNSQVKSYNYVGDVGYCLLFFLFPVFGLLTDVKIGRYKMIITGVYFSFASWVTCGIVVIINIYLNIDALFWLVLGLGYFLQVIGYGSFRSNIVQFNIDQLIGASADKLSAVIYLHSVTIPIVFVILEVVKCLLKEFYIFSYVVSGVSVSTVIVSNFLFKHWLDTTPHIINPVKLIAKVLNYARKNKYPRNRSALTYWEEDYPSRLDLGKEKYGGPFSEEQVENVKTVLRLIPLFVSVVGLMCGEEVRLFNFHTSHDNSHFLSCYVLYNALHFGVALLLIILYLLMLYKHLVKYIPSMLKRMSLGLALSAPLYYVILFSCKKFLHLNTTSYKAIIVPEMLYGISFALILPTSLEFTIAQSTHEMRGLMVGMWFAAFAIGLAVNINGKFPFKCENDIICQNLFYYVYKSVIIVIILVVFVILAKRYKLRVRENEVNIHMIAEEHYVKYIELEVEYRKEIR